MLNYEVWGIGYNKSGNPTGYLTEYRKFKTPGEALVFAHSINTEWLKEHGELPADITAVDIAVELCDEEEVFNEQPLYLNRVEIYHRMNSGLQSA